MPETTWHQTACILCSLNCGIEVRLDGRRLAGIRGDKAHPGSRGYACEKAQRLDHYQNGRHRLTSPLRRRPDGTFEEIDWDTAIAEVADRFPGEDGAPVVTGVAPNELTASDERDWLAGTPRHKHVPARIEAVAATAGAA